MMLLIDACLMSSCRSYVYISVFDISYLIIVSDNFIMLRFCQRQSLFKNLTLVYIPFHTTNVVLEYSKLLSSGYNNDPDYSDQIIPFPRLG